MAFLEYMEKYPTYPLAENVSFRLAAKRNTIDAYKSHLDRYPASKTSEEARSMLDKLTRQLTISTDFSNAQANDLGPLLRRYNFHQDAWAPALKLMVRTWDKLDAEQSRLIMGMLQPVLPSDAFAWIRGDLSLTSVDNSGSVATAVFKGVNGDRFRVYCDELFMDGESLGPVIYDFQLGLYRLPPQIEH